MVLKDHGVRVMNKFHFLLFFYMWWFILFIFLLGNIYSEKCESHKVQVQEVSRFDTFTVLSPPCPAPPKHGGCSPLYDNPPFLFDFEEQLSVMSDHSWGCHWVYVGNSTTLFSVWLEATACCE
jgi:hypothetical protein